jgi:hypothetical protein
MFAFAPMINYGSGPPIKVNFAAKNKNVSFNNSKRPFASQSGWKKTEYGKNLDFRKLVNTHERIGKLSKYGSVTRLSYDGNPHLYVMKTIPFTKVESHASFNTEIKVGQMKNINQVGPRVLAWRRLQGKGEYIMDNVERGVSTAKVYTFSQFKRVKIPGFLDFFKEVVERFHTITKGNHGDLHGGNILVVVDGNHIRVNIIDYGAFRNRKELLNARAKYRHYNMNVYNAGKGQGFIYNSDSLKNLLSNHVAQRRVRTSLPKPYVRKSRSTA